MAYVTKRFAARTWEAALWPSQLMTQSPSAAEPDAIQHTPAASPAQLGLCMHEAWTTFDVDRCQQSYHAGLCWNPAPVQWQLAPQRTKAAGDEVLPLLGKRLTTAVCVLDAGFEVQLCTTKLSPAWQPFYYYLPWTSTGASKC